MKTKYFLSALALTLIINFNFANALDKYTYDGTGSLNNNDFGNDVVVDNSGNVYVTGGTNTIPFLKEIITMKYAANSVTGTPPVWVKITNPDITARENSEGKKIALDNFGYVYVASSYNDGKSILITKLDPNNGSQIWSFMHTGDQGTIPIALAIDNVHSYVYVFGNKVNGASKQFILMRHPFVAGGGGIFALVIPTIRSSPNIASGLVLDNAGNIYMTGSVDGVTNMDYATFRIDYNALTLNTSFGIQYYDGANNNDWSVGIAIDNVTNVLFVTGYSATFLTGFDYATLKYSTAGGAPLQTDRYNKSNNHEFAVSLIVNPSDHNVFVTGYSYSNTNFKDDIVTLKYAGGNLVSPVAKSWSNTPYMNCFGCPSPTGNDIPTDMTFSADGSIFITGTSEDIYKHDIEYVTLKYDKNLNLKCTSLQDFFGSHDYSNAIASGNSGSKVTITGESFEYPNGDNISTISYQGTCTKIYPRWFFSLTLTDAPGSGYEFIDTATVEFRKSDSPYDLIKSYTEPLALNGYSGGAELCVEDLDSGSSFYIVLKHRNSIETWSANPVTVIGDSIAYDFSTSASQAFGNNMHNEEGKWVLYRGDCNQDGFIDLSDVSFIFNDAANFQTGHSTSDINDDDITDLGDLLITFNNAANFVSVKKPN